MDTRLEIKMDATDWRDTGMREETLPESETDVIDAIAAGTPTMRVARDLIVAQEMGLIKRLTRPNKTLLNVAAAYEVACIAKRQKATITAVNGTEYQVPAFVGRMGRPPEPLDAVEPLTAEDVESGAVPLPDAEDAPIFEPSYAPVRSAASLDYATRHMSGFIPGNIWNKLLEIHGAGGDVREQASALKARIDEMVTRILEQ
jgi:hypothetical protein